MEINQSKQQMLEFSEYQNSEPRKKKTSSAEKNFCTSIAFSSQILWKKQAEKKRKKSEFQDESKLIALWNTFRLSEVWTKTRNTSILNSPALV